MARGGARPALREPATLRFQDMLKTRRRSLDLPDDRRRERVEMPRAPTLPLSRAPRRPRGPSGPRRHASAVGPFVVPLGRAGRRHARSCRLIASGSSGLLDPGVGWRIARILVDREARVSTVVTVLSRTRRRGDLGFDFAVGRSGLPDDLKPPIIAGLVSNMISARRGRSSPSLSTSNLTAAPINSVRCCASRCRAAALRRCSLKRIMQRPRGRVRSEGRAANEIMWIAARAPPARARVR